MLRLVRNLAALLVQASNIRFRIQNAVRPFPANRLGRMTISALIWIGLHGGATSFGDVTWESHFVDEAAILNGSWIYSGGTRITFTSSVVSDSDGGTYDLTPGRNSSYFSFESGVTGNHTGYLELSMDNQNNDQVDYIELQLTFGMSVRNLQFSLLDVDGSPTRSWDDGVEVFYNGINVRSSPAFYSYGSAVYLDNESYMQGFEAELLSAAATETFGNIDFNFGSTAINSIRIRYRSTDDAVSNPAAQFIGISDLLHEPVPEPALTWTLALILGFAVYRGPRFPS